MIQKKYGSKSEKNRLLPYLHEKLDPVRKHFQNICPKFPQILE